MPVRIIDLSVPLRNDPNKIIKAQVAYQSHEEGARTFGPVFGLDPGPYSFKVAAFPIKIEGASAGWVRAVAIIEE